MKRICKNILPLIFLLVLIACFFVPIVEWNSREMSGMNFILSSQIPDTKYILLLIPGTALFVLFKLVRLKDIRIIPLFAAIIMFIICYNETSGKGIFHVMDFGYWLILGASFALVFVKPTFRVNLD